MTVLVVGLSVVFFVFQPNAAPTGASAPAAAPSPAAATAVAAPGTPARPTDIQRAPTPGIRVEPMAPPPAAIDQVPAASVAKPKPARPVKVARTPAAPKAAIAAKPAAEGDEGEEDEPKAKPRAAAAVQDETEDDK